MTALNSFLFVMLASNLVNLSNSANHTGVMNSKTNSDEPSLSCEPDQPLFMTPYLEKGEIETARCKSKVGKVPNAPYVPSYSGLFTVNETNDSNMFFWFFPALNNDTKAPVILWLEGGPGASGLYGLFTQNGPYIPQKNMSLKLRSATWIKEFQVIYVDSPVGTGFSFTNDDAGYSKNEDQVADNIYEFLQQFFRVFHEYAKNDLYVIGESYAGKYVPAVGYKIHSAGPPAQTKFKGIGIGSGLCDPETQMNFSDYYYQLGIIDRKQAAVIRNASKNAVENIRKGKFKAAFIPMNNIVEQIPIIADPNYLLEFAGYSFPYNFLFTEQPEDLTYYGKYARLPAFKKAVHVGNLTYCEPSAKVAKFLKSDFMRSVRQKLVPLMNNYKVLIFNGQLDLTFPYPQMVDFLHTVEWKFSDEYKNADRKIWKYDGKDEVAGYVHNVGDFYHILVRLAGHMVPYEQPGYVLDMVTRFIRGKPFF